jgi:hypothetical protein
MGSRPYIYLFLNEKLKLMVNQLFFVFQGEIG